MWGGCCITLWSDCHHGIRPRRFRLIALDSKHLLLGVGQWRLISACKLVNENMTWFADSCPFPESKLDGNSTDVLRWQ